MNKKNIFIDSLAAFVLTVLTMIVIFFWVGVLPGQENVIFPADLYHQCAVFGRLIMEKLQNGSNFFYSWNVGMGGNTSLLFAFVAMSPLNLFYLFINNIEIATLVIVILKPALAAAFFCAYGRYNLRQESKLVIAISIGYGVGSFYFAVMMMNSIAEGLYFLPLVLVFIKHFLDTGRKTGLTLIYALSFLSYFYGGFIVGISSLGYLCLCVFVHRQYTGRQRLKILFRYAACVATAILLSACVLLPAAYYAVALNSKTANTGFFGFVATPIWDILPCFLPGREYALDTPFPYLYCGLLTLILLFLYLSNREVAKREKICVAAAILVLILSMMVEPVYLALHMLNEPNGYTFRFAYVLSFVAASAAVRQLSCLHQLRFRPLIVFLLLTLAFYFASPVLDSALQSDKRLVISYKIIALIAVLMLLWIWLLYRYRNNQSGKGLILLAVLLTMTETAVNGQYLLNGVGYYYRDFYEIKHQIAENAIAQIQAEDDGIYRINYPDKHNFNMQTAYDYYGIAYFSSVVNEATSHALDRLGYARNGFQISDSCQNDVMKMIFGTKYTVHSPWSTLESKYEIIRNPYSLPLGYMVREPILSYAFSENIFENQQNLLECMTGEDTLCMEIYDGSVGLYPQNVNLAQVEQGIGVIGADLEAGVAYLKFTIPYQEGVSPYACFISSFNRDLGNAPWISTSPGIDTFRLEISSLSQPHIVPMVQEGEDYAVYIIFPDINTIDVFNLKNVDFALYHEDGLAAFHENLIKAGMQIEVMEDGYVRGRVVASEEKPVLFTSFPYEEGWKAFVDGAEQEIYPLLEGGFIGLRLEPGEHEIELRFTAPYSIQGKWLSLCGILLLLVLFVWDLCDNKKLGKR